MKILKFILPILAVAIGIYILIPDIIVECNSSWVHNECYASSVIDILGLIFLASYLYCSIQSENWAQRYLVSGGIVLSLIFYYLVNLTPDYEIPPLLAFILCTLIYTAPMLLLLQWAANRIKNKAKK